MKTQMKTQAMKELLRRVKRGDRLILTFRDSNLGGDLAYYLNKFLEQGSKSIRINRDAKETARIVIAYTDWADEGREYVVQVLKGFDAEAFDSMIEHGLFEKIEEFHI